jgi:hypothetical protein
MRLLLFFFSLTANLLDGSVCRKRVEPLGACRLQSFGDDLGGTQFAVRKVSAWIAFLPSSNKENRVCMLLGDQGSECAAFSLACECDPLLA